MTVTWGGLVTNTDTLVGVATVAGAGNELIGAGTLRETIVPATAEIAAMPTARRQTVIMTTTLPAARRQDIGANPDPAHRISPTRGTTRARVRPVST